MGDATARLEHEMRHYGLPGRKLPEDPKRCVVETRDRSGWYPKQCQRPRGHGLGGRFCRQHAKMYEQPGRRPDIPFAEETVVMNAEALE